MDAITLDGFLDEETMPGDLHGTTASFRISLSPTEERVDETVLPCRVADPVLAHAVLYELKRGDQLRVTGYLHLPQTPDDAMWLEVHAIEVLATSLLLDLGDEDEMDQLSGDGFQDDQAVPFIERYASYLVIYDPDGPAHVWHTTGALVGETDDPATIGDLINAYEHRTAGGTGGAT